MGRPKSPRSTCAKCSLTRQPSRDSLRLPLASNVRPLMSLMIAFVATLALTYANGWWLLYRLKSKHTAVWSSLGQPTLGGSNLSGPRLSWVRWLWSLRFRELQDTSLQAVCWAALGLEVCLMALFAAMLLP
jgi:hypothetical protein